MNTRSFAMVLGVVFLLVGILGFVDVNPILVHHTGEGHDLQVKAFDGYLLGLFHVNALHSAVHALFGILGIAMSRSWTNARLYCQIVAIAYGLLVIVGLIPNPTINTVFGLVPVHGNDVWLHALIAAAAAYFGFAAPTERVTTTGTTTMP